MARLRAIHEIILMRGMVLFPLMIVGLFTLVIPAWADDAPDTGPVPLQNLSLLPDPAIDSIFVSPGPEARAVTPSVDLSADDFIDTIPLISMDVPAVTSPVRVDLMLEESVVGLDSIDGVGVMVSW